MSFSAEVKDFVNGFKAGSDIGGGIQERKLKREKFESDKAFREARAGVTDARAARAEARANRALDLREKGLGIRSANSAAKDEAKAADKAHKDEVRDFNELTRSSGGGSKSSSSEELSDEYDFEESFPDTEESTDEYDSSEYEPIDAEEVRLADSGGMMEDDQAPAEGKGDLPAPAAPVEAAIPTEAPAAPAYASAAGKTDQEAAPAEGKADLDLVYKEVANITKEVMDQWEAESNEKPAAIDTNPEKSQDRVAAAEPATPEEMKAMWAKVDPTGELDGQTKGAKTLVSAYKFFMEKGDAVKAKKVAAQIVKFNQMASMTQGQMALEALREGDLQSASKLVSDAYNENVPDGGTLQATPTPNGTVLYKIDRAGYAQQQGELGAKEMWKIASGVADGSQFIKRMAALSGEADPTATSGSNEAVPAGGKKKRGSYSADVQAAAAAEAEYKVMEKAVETAANNFGSDSKEAAAATENLEAARQNWDTTMKRVRQAAKKTKRSDKVLAADLSNAAKLVVPGAPGGGKKDDKGAEGGENPPQEGAIPTTAAPPAGTPAIEDQRVLNGKTYVKQNGKWFEKSGN